MTKGVGLGHGASHAAADSGRIRIAGSSRAFRWPMMRSVTVLRKGYLIVEAISDAGAARR